MEKRHGSSSDFKLRVAQEASVADQTIQEVVAGYRWHRLRPAVANVRQVTECTRGFLPARYVSAFITGIQKSFIPRSAKGWHVMVLAQRLKV